MASHDLVLVCDGINSPIRDAYASEFGTTIDPRRCKFIWLGTDTVFDAFKFFVKETEWGVMQVHAYPMDAVSSTFIVEMPEDVWQRAGFDKADAADLPPGVSDMESIERIGEIFADALDGGSLIANNSQASCTFLEQGPTSSLSACLDACWQFRGPGGCNVVDWIAPQASPPAAADCVLKVCPDPSAPPLSPWRCRGP